MRQSTFYNHTSSWLIPVNGATIDDASVRTYLQEKYNPAIVEWQVDYDPVQQKLTLTDTELANLCKGIDVTLFTNYTEGQIAALTKYATEPEDKTYLLFISCQSLFSEWSNRKELLIGSIDIQLLNQQSLGVGIRYTYGDLFFADNRDFIIGYNIRHQSGDYVFYNKISYSKTFFIFNGGLSINNYTNFNGYTFTITPEIGVGFNPIILLYYSYNIECYRTSLNKVNTNSLTLRVWLPINTKKRNSINMISFR